MARLFDRASSQCVWISSLLVSAVPYSMACWFNVTNNTITHALMRFTDAGNNAVSLNATSGGIVNATTFRNAVCWAPANTSTSYSANTWHHACGVWIASNSRAVYLDGGGKGTSAVNCTSIGMNSTVIGAAHPAAGPGEFTDGRIAEAAIWDVALTDAEVLVLAKGMRPIHVRPQNIVAYWPLVRDQDYDLYGQYNLTPVNGPTVGAHVPIIYGIPVLPLGDQGGSGPSGAAVGLSSLTGLSALSGIMGAAAGGPGPAGPAGDALLKEDGDYLLKEDGDFILLE